MPAEALPIPWDERPTATAPPPARPRVTPGKSRTTTVTVREQTP